MTNWNDPATLQHQAVIFSNVIHFVSGLYVWELAINLPFDWSIASGKRSFRWPMLLYFACRYLMFFALVGVLVALNVTRQVNCQALYTFNQFAGNSAIGLASSLFMLRTIAVWNRSYYVTIPLVTICLGQWAILLHGMTTVVSVWNSVANQCVVTQSGTTFLDLIYFYTMSFDLTVLILTSVGLYLSPGRSSLWKLVFKDGVIFFAAAFVSNAFPAVFIAINLNAVMNIMFSVPAACIAAIFACRSFIRVSVYSPLDAYVHTSGPINERVSTRIGNPKNRRTPRNHPTDTFDSNTDLPFHTTTATAVNSGTLGTATTLSNGVHVLMDTFSESPTIGDDKKGSPDLKGLYPQSPDQWNDNKHGHSFVPDV
ncbi:hypothetical protein K439DRAFT_1400394 [Ramaria rubella]|nr:hypothetical protein K439DRAFT_1400394 [Ramaria rubella]